MTTSTQQNMHPDCLYVSTSLHHFFMLRHPSLARDITRDGITYRRLDGPYYAWLRHRFDIWIATADGSKVSREEAQRMVDSIAFIVDFAEERMGKEKLSQIMKQCNPKTYVAPGVEENSEKVKGKDRKNKSESNENKHQH